jgi:hypothetical protein
MQSAFSNTRREGVRRWFFREQQRLLLPINDALGVRG